MGAESSGQGPRYVRIFLKDDYTLIHTSPDFQTSSTADVNVRLGLWGGWETTTPQTSKLESRSEIRTTSGVQATFLSAARMVRPGAFRSSSAGSRLSLPPAPTLSGTRLRAACPL